MKDPEFWIFLLDFIRNHPPCPLKSAYFIAKKKFLSSKMSGDYDLEALANRRKSKRRI